jgi:hypothetical protein
MTGKSLGLPITAVRRTPAAVVELSWTEGDSGAWFKRAGVHSNVSKNC